MVAVPRHWARESSNDPVVVAVTVQVASRSPSSLPEPSIMSEVKVIWSPFESFGSCPFEGDDFGGLSAKENESSFCFSVKLSVCFLNVAPPPPQPATSAARRTADAATSTRWVMTSLLGRLPSTLGGGGGCVVCRDADLRLCRTADLSATRICRAVDVDRAGLRYVPRDAPDSCTRWDAPRP